MLNITKNEAASNNSANRSRRRRMAVWSLFVVLALSVALPLGSYSMHWLGMTAVAQEAGGATNPRSNYWRAVREGVGGYSAVKSPGANVLVQDGGTKWMATRNGPLMQKLPWAIAVVAGILLLYHLIRGRTKLVERHLTGRKIKRWSWFSRLVHWLTAVSFIGLAITGISMLIGRAVLIPLLGREGFALWAQASIKIHDFVGPVFTVGVALMIIMWIWHNFPTGVDLKWFAQGGGLLARNHPSAGRFNGGEKLWFWLLATVGVLVCFTGVLMVAPVFGIEIPGLEMLRADMQRATVVHAVASILWTAVAVGHIYIGSAGTEGALEGMSTGYVSEEWAKQHHDLWHEKMVDKGKIIEPRSASRKKRRSTAKTATAS
jgi:formate dehydrogenase subunit gamma